MGVSRIDQTDVEITAFLVVPVLSFLLVLFPLDDYVLSFDGNNRAQPWWFTILVTMVPVRTPKYLFRRKK